MRIVCRVLQVTNSFYGICYAASPGASKSHDHPARLARPARSVNLTTNISSTLLSVIYFKLYILSSHLWLRQQERIEKSQKGLTSTRKNVVS